MKITAVTVTGLRYPLERPIQDATNTLRSRDCILVEIHTRLLGGYRDRVPTYASAEFYIEGKGLQELTQEAGQVVAKGFRGMKIKVGRLSLAEDMQRVAMVREALGSERDLMVDANSSWELNRNVVQRYSVYRSKPV